MVIRTEVCSFSDQKIYPGHGSQLINRDCKLHNFSSKKSKKMFIKKVRGQVIRWTIIWRRINKKIKNSSSIKKKKKRARVVLKDIQGLKREDIKRERGKTSDERTAQREKAIREIKERKAKLAATKKTTAKAGNANKSKNVKNTRKN